MAKGVEEEETKMAETKYGKYIVTEYKSKVVRASWEPKFPPEEQTHILRLDSEVVEGAFYTECTWFWPIEGESTPKGQAHKHDFDEVLTFFGTNWEDPHDLCAELEAWLGDEKHIITKSCMIFVPKGLQHGPFRFTRIDRPVFHFSCGTNKMYF